MKAKYFNFTMVLIIILTGLVCTVPERAFAQDTAPDFISLSQEVSLMQQNGLIWQDEKLEVDFDSQAAEKMGYSEESIKLAQELVDLSNTIVTTRSINQNMSAYPSAASFFSQADAYEASKAIESGNEIQGWANEYYCGTWWHPVPNSGALWNTTGPYSSQRAAEQTLRNWGYHATPNLAGGGWTRPQTYKWWYCGWNTFRDHAYIYSSRYIREQNYTGSIPGEPNPEVWASRPWPYPTWPAYVAWWHSRY